MLNCSIYLTGVKFSVVKDQVAHSELNNAGVLPS